MSALRSTLQAVEDLPHLPPSVSVMDSHTEGEPTRVIVGGWPEPRGRTMQEKRDDMEARFGLLRRATICEPRGHEAVVGAFLTSRVHRTSEAGVVFFNNVGCLGMCGHGLMGVVRTLEEMGRIGPGRVEIDTPVGTVSAVLHDDGEVTISSVRSYCHALDVSVEVPGVGRITGDVAYGGNWFFITHLPEIPLEFARVEELTRVTRLIQSALLEQGIRGDDGGVIDHVELTGPPVRPDADARNFVLCPGGEYDRSPCGTGTSAKMAVLHARGELEIEERWRQESIIGSMFTGWLTENRGVLTPHISGRVYVTALGSLYFDSADPFRGGISPHS